MSVGPTSWEVMRLVVRGDTLVRTECGVWFGDGLAITMKHPPNPESAGCPQLPIIDIAPLLSGIDEMQVAHQLDAACRDVGFFLITGHGIDPDQLAEMDQLAREFFNLPEVTKSRISMTAGGPAWRGWFPVGDELTSGRPDRKEGLYVGTELAADDPRVLDATPLHGANQFPQDPEALGPAILAWTAALTPLAHALMRGIALGLGLPGDWFVRNLTHDPTILFRIFHYPPGDDSDWGVAEHTDYGLLTLLAQDDSGGLQVHTTGEWIDVPADPGVIVCNIGDMLDRLTEGRYRSTPHRVRNLSGKSRLSFPFFFDPSWDAEVRPLPLEHSPPATDVRRRWDGADLQLWDGAYGGYLSAKVAKVFPDLFGDTIDS